MSNLEGNLQWTTVRDDAIEQFNGQTPRPEDEARIIDVFEIHPQQVARAIEETAKALAGNKITWAWSVLRSRLERGSEAVRNATVDTTTERSKRIANAEQWIRNTGIHYDRPHTVEAELFGDEFGPGPLTDYADDQPLRARLLKLWQTERPRGIQAEHEHEHWMATCKGKAQAHDDAPSDAAC